MQIDITYIVSLGITKFIPSSHLTHLCTGNAQNFVVIVTLMWVLDLITSQIPKSSHIGCEKCRREQEAHAEGKEMHRQTSQLRSVRNAS